MREKTIFLFDCDGTILDSFTAGQKMLTDLAKKFKTILPNINGQEFKQIWGTGGYNMIKHYFPNCNPDEVHREWKKLENSIRIDLIDSAKKIIDELKKQEHLVGLLTNRSWKSLKRYPDVLKLDFDFIQTSEYKFKYWLKYVLNPLKRRWASRSFKPRTKFFKLFFEWLKRKKIKPKKIYYVGDCLVDFQVVVRTNAIRGCNIRFVGVLTGPIKTRREWYEITGAKEKFLILNSIASLMQWLNEKGDENSSPLFTKILKSVKLILVLLGQ